MVNTVGFDNEIIVNLNARLRTLESRHKDLRQMVAFLRNNVQEIRKIISEELKDTGADLRSLERRFDDFEMALDILKKEVVLRTPKEEFDVLKKYIEYWNPANFVTVDQLGEELSKLKKKH